MKNDPLFKFAAAVILAGVILALATPAHAIPATPPAAVCAPSWSP